MQPTKRNNKKKKNYSKKNINSIKNKKNFSYTSQTFLQPGARGKFIINQYSCKNSSTPNNNTPTISS